MYVARAIVSEMHRTHAMHVYSGHDGKVRGISAKAFPAHLLHLPSYGLDLATDMAPVCPAAHYMMGGSQNGFMGRTSLPGLYAAGETADTECMAPTGWPAIPFLEGLVFGARAGDAMLKDAPAVKHKSGTATRIFGAEARQLRARHDAPP
jgi:L-aspartate oxidase